MVIFREKRRKDLQVTKVLSDEKRKSLPYIVWYNKKDMLSSVNYFSNGIDLCLYKYKAILKMVATYDDNHLDC